MRNLSKISVFILATLFVSCKEKFLIEKHFSPSEIVTINEIIDYYDNWVVSKTGEEKISKAYLKFLEATQPKVLEENNTEYLLPEKEKVRIFLSSINQENLGEIYVIEDFYLISNKTISTFDTITSPYSLRLNYPGKFISFMRNLKDEKGKFRPYFESIDMEANIGPAAFAEIVLGYKEINFEIKDERFVFIVTMLDLM